MTTHDSHATDHALRITDHVSRLTPHASCLRPTIAYESPWWAAGYLLVAGIDEVGRGALAGPVVAAAVILPACTAIPAELAEVADSKLLDAAARERLYPIICAHAISYAVGSVPADEIDRIGIAPATRVAMLAALEQLRPQPQVWLIDAFPLPDEAGRPQVAIIDGDALSLSIAAASIVAKVTRDRMLVQLDAQYPGYGLAQHKGYGTAQHQAALATLGACVIHRRSYEPVAQVIAGVTPAAPAGLANPAAGQEVVDV